MTALPHKSRWLRFSLRAIFLIVLLLSLPCTWIACRVRHAKSQDAAVRALGAKGVLVWHDYEVTNEGGVYFDIDANGRYIAPSPPEPQWLRETLGVETLRPVTRLGIASGTDGGLTDTDLRHLRALPNIEILILRCPGLSDGCLKHLCHVKRLRHLDLYLTPITDRGLSNLEGLSQLEYLRLEDTQVTEDGLRRIRLALPNCAIEYKRR